MADFLNNTGLAYYHNRLKTYFATKSEVTTISESIPDTVSDLTNDAGYQTAAEVEQAINDALADVVSIRYESVDSLPAQGEAGVIYLVPSSTGSGTNVKDEYIWTGNAFEKIGSTDIDLTGYWSKQELVAITTAQIDTLFA